MLHRAVSAGLVAYMGTECRCVVTYIRVHHMSSSASSVNDDYDDGCDTRTCRQKFLLGARRTRIPQQNSVMSLCVL